MFVHVSGLIGVRLRAFQGCIVVAVVVGGVGLVVVDFCFVGCLFVNRNE
jgi:hypothetical protein